MFVLDSHCDTPLNIYRRGIDLSVDNENAHVDFPKLKAGGVDAAFFAIYTSNTLSQTEAKELADNMLAAVKKEVGRHPKSCALATTSAEALANKAKGLFSVFLGMENGLPIGKSLDALRSYYDQGIRYLTLTHAGDNDICDSCATEVKTWHGLSPFGREVVAEMNRIGMLIDVAHISDESFWDVIKYSTKPVVSTHSCCRALADRPRNMTDEMIKALADNGGVIQINFYPYFLDGNYNDGDLVRPSYKRIVDHIDHVVQLVGVEHVGLGSDFDGIDYTPEGVDSVADLPKVLLELKSRGYSKNDISKIAGENFLRVLDIVTK